MISSNLCGNVPVKGSYADLYLHNVNDGLGKPLSHCSKEEVATYAMDLACVYLEKCGLEVIGRDWQSKLGGADIECRDGRRAVLVEVRPSARDSKDCYEEPIEIKVGPRSRKKYRESTMSYFSKHAALDSVRYDVIGMRIYSGHDAKLRHIVGAFGYEQ